jgi:hypothetical protein
MARNHFWEKPLLEWVREDGLPGPHNPGTLPSFYAITPGYVYRVYIPEPQFHPDMPAPETGKKWALEKLLTVDDDESDWVDVSWSYHVSVTSAKVMAGRHYREHSEILRPPTRLPDTPVA